MSFFPPGLMWILPNRMAVTRAREKLLAESEAGVVLAPKIYHFGQLENILARELRVEITLTPAGQAMVLEGLLEAEGASLNLSASQLGPSLILRVAQLIEELKGSEVDPDTFGWMGRMLSSNPKIDGFERVFRAYQDFLGQKGLRDRSDSRQAVVRALVQGDRPRTLDQVQEIVLRDFNRLTPFQVELTKALSRVVKRVEVNLICPDWLHNYRSDLDLVKTGNPFAETLATIRGLESVDSQSALELNLKARTPKRPPALAWLGNLFRPDPAPSPAPEPDGAIEIWAAPGRYAEVEEIGRRIWDLVENGTSPDRIALAVRDLGVYGDLIEDVFRRFRLPLFFRRGAPLAIQAPVRALLACLRLASSPWPRELVLDILASPYLTVGISIPWPRAASLCARANVTDDRAGGGWQQNLERLARTSPADSQDIADLLAAVERLKTWLPPLVRSQTWSEFAAVALDLLGCFRLEENIKKSRVIHLQRDLLALKKLTECLGELQAAARQAGLENRVLTPDKINRGLKKAIQEKTIGQIGTGTGGIMVLNAFDLHGLTFDHLFLAGINEDEFPKNNPEGLIIDDALAKVFNQTSGRRIFKTATANYRQEELAFYHALAGAGTSLVLSYNHTDEKGRVRLPSALLDEVVRLWPEGVLETQTMPSRVRPPLEDALTREELFCGLAENLLGPVRDEAVLAREVLPGLLAGPEERSRWESLAGRALMEQARVSGQSGPFSGLVSSKLFSCWVEGLKRETGAPLLSPTLLEEYGRCPFAFWAKRILGLEPSLEADDELNPMDEGSIMHRIVRLFFARCQNLGHLPLTGDPEEAVLLKEETARVLAEAGVSLSLGRQPLWRIRVKNMERILDRWLAREQKNADVLIPSHFEWVFGPQRPKSRAKAPPFEVDLLQGGKLSFQGRVDRIDLGPDLIRIIDYKNSGNRSAYNKLLTPEEMGRTSFQPPVYQLAAAEIFNRPAMATWVLFRDLKDSPLKRSPATDDEFFAASREKRRQLQENKAKNFFNLLEETWDRLKSGIFSPTPETGNCDFCEFRLSCRFAESTEDSNSGPEA